MADTYIEIEVAVGLKSGGLEAITYQPERDSMIEDEHQLIIHVIHSKTWTEKLHIARDNISFVRQQIRELTRDPEERLAALAIN